MSPIPIFTLTSTTSSAPQKANGGPIAGIETPSRYTIVFHLTKPTAGAALRRAQPAAVGAGAAGIRQAARRAQPHDVRHRIPRRHRSLHVEVQQSGQVPRDRLPARQVRDARAQPQLEPAHRLPAGVPRPDRHQHRRRTDRDRPAGPQGAERRAERLPGAVDRQGGLRALPPADHLHARARATTTPR